MLYSVPQVVAPLPDKIIFGVDSCDDIVEHQTVLSHRTFFTDDTPIEGLLVEDNPGDVRLIWEELIEIEGAPISLECVGHLAAAQQILNTRDFDVVILDLSLPDEKGLTTVKRLRGYSPHVPIVVLTGFDDEALAVEALREGAQDYLVKGEVDGRLLARALRYAIERKRAGDERDQLLARERMARAEAETCRAQAEEANRLKDDFLATVSHELRTPLTSILGWSHLLQVGDLNSEQSARGLEAIKRNAKAQARLIDDLLDVSRIITGKLRIDARPIELSSVIEAAVDTIRPTAEAKNIRLDTHYSPPPHPVLGDQNRLQQVVWNLLSNAIKFTPCGGQVRVRLDCADTQAKIIVSDNGEGIDVDALPFVFERFRQADSSSIRMHGGLGLGLAIVRHLAELHGGTAEAHSDGAGRGATFTVTLPLISEVVEPSAERRLPNHAEQHAAVNHVPVLDNLRVLVVEDDEDTRAAVILALARYGAEVVAASTVTDAMAALERIRPDVLVADIAMPDEDGFALIRKVRALPETLGGDVPAVALTAYARGEDRMRLLSSGFQMHVPKPVEPSELAVVIESLAGRTGNG